MTDFTEPRPHPSLAPFDAGDFRVLGPSYEKNPEYNDARLAARRKLLALAKAVAKRAAAGGEDDGVALEARTSLHHPHAFNGMRVRRLWAYLVRSKAEKGRLRKVIGRDLAKDLDAAYRNAYLCLALESEVLEVSLRIHIDAWYDGQNLVKRVAAEGQAGLERLLELLNALPGYRLQLADWKGEWVCGGLTRDRLEEFLRFYVPGEHALEVVQRRPLGDWAYADDLPERLVEELLALVPLYAFAAWSANSNFLFGGSL